MSRLPFCSVVKSIGDFKPLSDVYCYFACVYMSQLLQGNKDKKKIAKKIPADFPSANFFRECVSYTTAEKIAADPNLATFLRVLMQHTINTGIPALWIPNASGLIKIPNGMDLINNIPPNMLDGGKPQFWDELAKVVLLY